MYKNRITIIGNVSQNHGRICNRGLAAPATVAHRSGVGAGALGTDAQEPQGVTPGDGAATAADAAHLNHFNAQPVVIQPHA